MRPVTKPEKQLTIEMVDGNDVDGRLWPLAAAHLVIHSAAGNDPNVTLAKRVFQAAS